MLTRSLSAAAGLALLGSCAANPAPGAQANAIVAEPAQRCAALGSSLSIGWPDAGTRVTSASYREAGPAEAPPAPPGMAMPPVILPAHCELTGIMEERKGVDGQDYAIRFHLHPGVQVVPGEDGRTVFLGLSRRQRVWRFRSEALLSVENSRYWGGGAAQKTQQLVIRGEADPNADGSRPPNRVRWALSRIEPGV